MIIKKDITRELQLTGYHYKGKVRPVMVTLTTQETLVFRPKGTRHRIEVDLSHCVNLAEIFSAERIYQDEIKRYKAGTRKRKPKKKYYPYSQVYFKAIETVKTR